MYLRMTRYISSSELKSGALYSENLDMHSVILCFLLAQNHRLPDSEDQTQTWNDASSVTKQSSVSTAGSQPSRVRMPLGALSRLRSTALGVSADWNVSVDGDVNEYRVSSALCFHHQASSKSFEFY